MSRERAAPGSDVATVDGSGPEARDTGPSPARRRSDLLVGASPHLARVLELVSVAARTDIAALIVGESGTGKELVARAIHYTGSRANRPFITVNCGAIPETLMEDELFGHVRGAYTGAHADKRGVFEEAEGGTLFLDEIGELYPSCQVKLLRVLQEDEVRRLGDTRTRKVDVRVIAATNKDLKKEMEEKRFREDLYHRISVLPIPLPPLRDRRDDVPLLVDHFVRQFNRELGRTIRGFTPRALDRLKSYSWPGNVRELENRVKQAMVMSKTERIDVESLSLFAGPGEVAEFPIFRKAKEEFERNYVMQALRLSHGKVAGAARLAGKDRKDFYDLMRKHRIDPDDYRD
ncbi:MAG TPA: sigma-54 dependent transcriptional regulator [Candidatus Polarisedimenticolia bacterium]|nr:sigma-54 dependent transcriptional regulator [Candidatus Polarisedimenticolia bacterium]